MVKVASPSVRSSTLVMPMATGIAIVLNQEASVISIHISTHIWWTMALFSSGLGHHVTLTTSRVCSLKIANVRLDTKASWPGTPLERTTVVAFHVSFTVVVYFRTAIRFHSPCTIGLFCWFPYSLIDDPLTETADSRLHTCAHPPTVIRWLSYSLLPSHSYPLCLHCHVNSLFDYPFFIKGGVLIIM